MRRALHRHAMVGAGATCVALGAMGVFVPGMPTTVFLLLASYLFARSSPDLQRRLWEHPRLGVYLRMATGGMPMRARVVSIGAMWCGIGVSAAFWSDSGGPAAIVMAALGVLGTASILVWGRRRIGRGPARRHAFRAAPSSS